MNTGVPSAKTCRVASLACAEAAKLDLSVDSLTLSGEGVLRLELASAAASVAITLGSELQTALICVYKHQELSLAVEVPHTLLCLTLRGLLDSSVSFPPSDLA